MHLTFLGTGTSQGIPVIGCACSVCQSKDKRDKRLRTSALVADEETTIAIDCGPDFRTQMLRENVTKLDAVIMTHEHSDHIAGIEDLRPYQFATRQSMPIYATPSVQNNIRQRYDYAFFEDPYPGAVQLDLRGISADTPFNINTIYIQPIEVNHGSIKVLGFRFGELTYITDCKSISNTELEKVKNTPILILDALHHQEHHAHLTLKQALELIEIIKPQQAFLIHMSHNMGLHKEVNKILPKNVRLAYDGLKIEFEGF